MSKKRSLIVLVMVFVFSLVVFTATPILAEKVTITWWGPFSTPAWQDWQLKQGADFTVLHPDIKVESLQFGGYPVLSKVMTAIAAGDPPDVLFTGANYVREWVPKGVFRNLDDFYERDVDVSNITTAAKIQVMYEGSWYALCSDTLSYGIFYNTDIAQELGLDPDKPPVSIKELDEWSEKMTILDDQGNITRGGFFPWIPWDEGFHWGYAFGGDFSDETGTIITANDPKIVEAYEWYVSYVNKYGINALDKFLGVSQGMEGQHTPIGPFYNGQIAMQLHGCWFPNLIKLHNPDLNWSFMPAPSPPGGRPASTITRGNALFLPAAAKHPEEAWELSKFMAFPPRIMAYNIKNSVIPAWYSIFDDPKFFEALPYMRKFVDLARSPNALPYQDIPVVAFYQDQLNAARDYIIHLKKTPKEALDAVTKAVQKELDIQSEG